MSRFNPLPYLPSARSLLYPFHFAVKVGIVLYDNELPGRHRNARANMRQNGENVSNSLTLERAASKTVAPEVFKSTIRQSLVSVTTAVDVSEPSTPKSAACGKKQTNVEKKVMIDASTQTDLDAVATGISSDGGISETETGEKMMIETPTQANGDESVVDSSSNDGRSSPITLVNTPTDHSSQVDVENNEQDGRAGSEDVSPEAQIGEEQVQEFQNANQELRNENAELRSSVEDLANASSQEREKTKAAEERAAAAEERMTIVAERATGLGTHMQSLGQDFGTQVTRAANAEAEAMRMRVQMWDMRRDDFLAPDEEPIQEHGQPSNDLDQTMEQNNLSRTPLIDQEYSEDHESLVKQIEETIGDFQDVTEDLTAADSTSTVQEGLLSIEVAAHQRTREELIQLKAKMTENESRLQMSEDLDIEQLRTEQEHLQTLLDNADSQISDFDAAYRRLRTRVQALQTQVDDQAERLGTANFYELKLLEALATKNSEAQKEVKERKFFVQLGKKLYDRVKKAEKLLKGALGRDDDLMRLAEERLPKPTPSTRHLREIQLAIEGPPAESSTTQNAETFSEYKGLLDDIDTERPSSGLFEVQDGTAVDNGNFDDVEAVEPAFNSFAVPGSSFVSGTLAQATESEPHDIAAKISGFAFSLEFPARETQQEIEGSAKKPVFTFGGTPAQGSQRKAEGATKKPVFAFGGTNAQESQQKAESAAKKPVFQFFAPPVQEARQEKPLGATTSPQSLNPTQKTAVPETSGVHVADSTHDHTLAPSAPRVRPFAPVTLEPKQVGTPVDPTAHLAETSDCGIEPVPDFNFGGTASAFRAQTSPNPILNSKADSGRFNSTPRTDFNFGATNAFKAGPSLSKAAPKAFGVAKDDEQDEGPTKKNKTASKIEAPSFIDLSSSSSIAKEETEEATKKTTTASIFDAAASVNLSSPSSDGKAPVGASVDRDPIDASKTPKSTFTRGFNIPGTSTKEDAKKHQPAPKTQTIPIFGAGISNQFFSSPRHVRTTFDGFKSVSAGTSIAPSGDDNQAEAMSTEPTQGFSGTLPLQLPGLSVCPDSSSSVHSAPPTTGSTETRGGDQQPENRMGLKEKVGALQEVTGAPSDEISRTSSTPPSTSEGKVEGEAADVFGTLGFDAGALTRIVASVTPAVQENLGGDDLLESLVPPNEATEPGGDVRQCHFTTAAENIAVSATADGVNRQEPPTASIPWREPVWPAELPPYKPEPEWSAVLTRLAGTPTTATNSHQPPAATQGAASRKRQNIEEEIDAIMDGIASLHIGSAMPPGGMQRYEPYVLLSGDWIERQYTIRRTIEREVDDIENKVETREKSLTQTGEAREVEVTSEDVRHEHEIAREGEPDVTESPTLTHPEIGNREASASQAGEAQEATANCEQERSAEPEVAVENESQEMGSTSQSNDGVKLETAPRGSPQMRAEVGPQMELQMEEQVGMEMEMELQMENTATAQAPESIAGPSRESREQTNDPPPPKKPSGGLRIWSLRKQR